MGSLGKGRHFPPGAWSKGVAARPEEWPAATALAFERPGDSAQGAPSPRGTCPSPECGLLLHPALCPGPCKQRFVSSHRLLLYKPLSCGLCFQVIPPAPTASRPSSGLADSRNGHGLRVPSSRLCSLSPRRGLCGLQDGVPTVSAGHHAFHSPPVGRPSSPPPGPHTPAKPKDLLCEEGGHLGPGTSPRSSAQTGSFGTDARDLRPRPSLRLGPSPPPLRHLGLRRASVCTSLT